MSAEPATQGFLEGQQVAVTGRLASMTRAEVVELIDRLGGQYHARVGASTTILVIGQEGWPLSRDGHLTRDLRLARRRQEEGEALRIWSEGEFFERVGLGERQDGIRRLYTSEQLSRILKVPRTLLQSWMRIGLIRPLKTVRRLCYFDFEQVAGAKVLSDLWRRGASPARIRQSLEQLQGWFPNVGQSLAQLEVLEEGGELLVRLDDGRLADPSGQLHLDFTAAPAPADSKTTPRPLPRLARDWFQVAVHHEETGELEEAAEAYHRALLENGPRAEIAFNLGNVLYALDRRDAAAQRFMQAVETDSQYVEAWNNLGNVLAELGRIQAAIEAYRQALRIDPSYADAHYNLGEALHQVGRRDEARRHFEDYLAQDPHSAWARQVRELLVEDSEPDLPRL